MHRELCAHSPTGAQSERAGHWHARHTGEQGLWQWQSERHARQCLGAPRRPPLARPRQRCRARLQQLPEPSTFLQPPGLAYKPLHRKSRFFILGIGQRRLCHQILLVALITMVCSDMADCNASSRDCKSKSGAPWQAATGCQSCLHPPWRGMEGPQRSRERIGPQPQASNGLRRHRRRLGVGVN